MDMRDIKFRGKRIDNGEWVFGDIWQHNGRVDIVDHRAQSHPVDPKTVGQFIGLTVVETDVYEGDVVIGLRPSHWHSGYDKVRAVVIYEDDIQAFSAGGRLHNIDDLEVIGNIHDNPELLQPQGGGKNE